MPKPSKRKLEDFQTSMTKSLCAAGRPNTQKAESLSKWQGIYVSEINRFITVIDNNDCLDDLVYGNAQSSAMRKLERVNRNESVGISATLSQAAFDEAFTKMQNREESIRRDVISSLPCCLTLSKKLYCMAIHGCSKVEMIEALNQMIKDAILPECRAAAFCRKDQTDQQEAEAEKLSQVSSGRSG